MNHSILLQAQSKNLSIEAILLLIGIFAFLGLIIFLIYKLVTRKSKKSRFWTTSIILAIASVISFFLPWFETTSKSSFGGQSLSHSMQGSPAAALIVYIQWIALSVISIFLAYRKSRFSFIPALLNFYLIFSALGVFGKGNSIGYSAYGASVSSSTNLTYGYWIFAITTILFFFATIGELFKNRSNEVIGSSLVKEGIPSKNVALNKRSLEELKQAKELLDQGAITQAEFDQIKHQALGSKPVVEVKQPQEEVRKEEKPSTPTQTKQTPIQKPVEQKVTTSQLKASNKKMKWLVGGIILVLIILTTSFFVFRSSNDSTDSDDFVAEIDTTLPTNDNEQSINSILDFSKSYSGTINEKYRIEMNITNEQSVLAGGYRYVGKGVYLIVKGEIDGNGNFSLDEFDSDGNITGHFEGKLTENVASGLWSNPAKNKTFPFLITEISSNPDSEEVDPFTVDSLSYIKSQTSIPENDTSPFANDNLSLDQVEKLKVNFVNMNGIEPYNGYENYEIKLDLNSPKIDLKRAPVKVGSIWRMYFEDSQNVAMQTDNSKRERIDLHPNGEIYFINTHRKNIGWVDLNKHVIMRGEGIRQINGYNEYVPSGMWDTPSMMNFNMSDNILMDKYPGTYDQVVMLINFYWRKPEDRR